MKSKNEHSVFWVQILLLFLLSCSENRAFESSITLKTEQQVNKKIMQFVEQWKSDSLGCQKLRSKDKAEAIIDSLKLDSATRVEFIAFFGKPNANKERQGGLILSYYFDAVCSNGIHVDSSDFCIAEFTFIENKLKKRSYICF